MKLIVIIGVPCGRSCRFMGYCQSLFEWLAQCMYVCNDGSQCAVGGDTGQTDWFDVKSGVKQGCNMF